jgi:hypothetical protein
MSFVVHYLPYFKAVAYHQPAVSLPAFLAFLFTDSSCGDQLLASPHFSSVLSAFSPPLLFVSFQFIVYCSFFFFCMGVQSAQGAMLVYPRGG